MNDTGPRIERSLTLHMRGDWGIANLHRVCGWLSTELTDRSGSDTKVAIWNGRGFSDNVRAVGRGEVDVAMTTPVAFTTAALTGRGVFEGEPFPNLRTLGVIPQDDRLVVAVHRSLGVSTFAELRDAKPVLRVATSINDGINYVGLAAHEVLNRSGVDVLGWGGQFLEDERPFESLDHVLADRANAIVHEAYMLPAWQKFAPDYNFLEVEEDVLSSLEADFGWPAGTVADNHFDQTPGFRTLDFSDFLMVTRSDLPDDVAHLIAWILGETRHVIEGQYKHLAPERSPITYPLNPVAMGISPVPLHPGAATYYEGLAGNS